MSRFVPLDVAANIAKVKVGTIRVWLTRGHLSRHPDGVDLYELVQWLDTIRNMEKARGAVLATHARYQTRREAS